MLSAWEILGDWGLPEFLLGQFLGHIRVELAPVWFGKQWNPLLISVACRVISGFAGLWCIIGILEGGSGGCRGPH